MSTTNQQQGNSLTIRLADLGMSQKLADLGPNARVAINEDLYQLGLVFLYVVLASFSEDFKAANNVRKILGTKDALQTEMP